MDKEYKKNRNKTLKYLTNIQLEYDIYDYIIDNKCKPIGKLGNKTTYMHDPFRINCNCGFRISDEKYNKLVDKLNKNIKSY